MATTKHYIVQSFSPSQTQTNEVHTVLDGKFLLDYIPDQVVRVTITGYTEIPWRNTISSATEFKVNYQNGEVQTHSSKESESITVTSYAATGVIKYYADRIVLDDDTVLQDWVDGIEDGDLDSSQITNDSNVIGDSVTEALNSLSSVVEAIETADSNAQIGVYSLSASGTNTYIATYSGLTYFSGLKVSLTIPQEQVNTGASTLNINELGAKGMKYYDSSGDKQDFVGGELIGIVEFEYDETDFVLV
jgi:hypothetical protein